MTWLRTFLPDRLSVQLIVLIIGAMCLSYGLALSLAGVNHSKQNRLIYETALTGRIAGLHDALTTLQPNARSNFARATSSSVTQVSITAEPLVRQTAETTSAVRMAGQVADALNGEQVFASNRLLRDGLTPDLDLPSSDRPVAFSVALSADDTATAWLNVATGISAAPFSYSNENTVLAALAFFGMITIGVGAIFSRQLTRPLDQLAVVARSVSLGNRNMRVTATGPREIRDAANAFNTMQDEIGRFDKERLRVVAAVGHDLRTPMTSLRIRLEMVEDSDLKNGMIASLDEMTALADGLIAYGRDGHGDEHMVEVALDVLLARICASRGVPFEGQSSVEIVAGSVSLTRAFGNLVDNAVQHGGSAVVTLAVEKNQAIISIRDFGPGIPDDQILSVFEPFVQGDGSRNNESGNVGLGLSIAQSIIQAHEGKLMISNVDPSGLLATIRLPIQGP
jgi:signal transduction histidine kinase